MRNNKIFIKMLNNTAAIVFIMLPVLVFAAPVPDTGQTRHWNFTDIFGEDADYNINTLSYTKLDANGAVLPDSATTWSTVRDNVTGLIWEVKHNYDGQTNYADPNDADNHYTWYDEDPATNGGYAGTPGNGSDTQDFLNDLNAKMYGGYNDWRMPNLKDVLHS